MEVGAGDAAGGTGEAEALAFVDAVAGVDIDAREVHVEGLEA